MNKDAFLKRVSNNRKVCISLAEIDEVQKYLATIDSSTFKKNACIEINIDDSRFISSERISKSNEWRTKLTGQVINTLKVNKKKIDLKKPEGGILLAKIILKEKSGSM